MRTDKNFKLSKSAKRMLALMPFKTRDDRNAFKRRMIDAEASEIQAKITRSKEREKS